MTTEKVLVVLPFVLLIGSFIALVFMTSNSNIINRISMAVSDNILLVLIVTIIVVYIARKR